MKTPFRVVSLLILATFVSGQSFLGNGGVFDSSDAQEYWNRRFGKDVFAVARAAAKSFIRLNNEGRKIRKQQPVRQQQQHKAHLLLRQKLPQEEVHPKAIISQRGKLKLKKLYLTSSTQSFFRSLHGAPISMMQVKTDDEKDTSAPKKEEKDDAEKAPKVLYYDSRNFGSASDWIATMTKYNKA